MRITTIRAKTKESRRVAKGVVKECEEMNKES